MNEPDINPKLKHCEDEVLHAIRSKDMVKLKEILIREGLPWMIRDEDGNYIPESLEDSCNKVGFD